MRHALKHLRHLFVVLVLLLVLGGLGGPSSASDQATSATKGGTIVVGVDAETPGWDPPDGLIGLSGRIVMGAVYDSLTAPAPDGSFRPNLATSVKSNGSKIWTIKLRRGVKFQDGTQFNAFAVEYHINRVIGPKSAVRATLNYIKSAKALNRYTVQIILNQPRADFPLTLSGGLGEVVSGAAVRRLGTNFRTRPVGAGPYRMTEWVRDDHVTLQRWGGYFRKDQPYADKIVIRPIPDESARAAGLRAGNLDVIFTQNPTDIKSFRNNNRVKLREIQYGTTGLYLNTSKPPMNDIRVRKAISYALNRQELINTVWNGIGVPTNSPFPKSSFWANSKVAKPWDTFNLSAAKSLVDAYENATGRKVEFSIISRVSQTEQLYKQALQAQLARAGITVRIEQVTDDNTYVTRLIRGDYEVATRLFGGFLDPVFEITRLYSKGGLLNIDRFTTDELERNIQIGVRSQNRTARKKAYDKIQQILKDNVIGIYVRTNTVGIAMKPTINIANWRFPGGARGLGHEYITMINVDSLYRSR
jgi:peptide/nickel transport system substrate-binding protein